MSTKPIKLPTLTEARNIIANEVKARAKLLEVTEDVISRIETPEQFVLTAELKLQQARYDKHHKKLMYLRVKFPDLLREALDVLAVVERIRYDNVLSR